MKMTWRVRSLFLCVLVTSSLMTLLMIQDFRDAAALSQKMMTTRTISVRSISVLNRLVEVGLQRQNGFQSPILGVGEEGEGNSWKNENVHNNNVVLSVNNHADPEKYIQRIPSSGNLNNAEFVDNMGRAKDLGLNSQADGVEGINGAYRRNEDSWSEGVAQSHSGDKDKDKSPPAPDIPAAPPNVPAGVEGKGLSNNFVGGKNIAPQNIPAAVDKSISPNVPAVVDTEAHPNVPVVSESKVPSNVHSNTDLAGENKLYPNVPAPVDNKFPPNLPGPVDVKTHLVGSEAVGNKDPPKEPSPGDVKVVPIVPNVNENKGPPIMESAVDDKDSPNRPSAVDNKTSPNVPVVVGSNVPPNISAPADSKVSPIVSAALDNKVPANIPAGADDKVPPNLLVAVDNKVSTNVSAAAGDKAPQPGSAAGVVPAAAGDKAPQPGSPAGVVPAAAGDKVPQPGSPAGVVPAAAGDKVPQPGSPAGVVPAAAGDKVPQPGSAAGVVPAAAGDKAPQPGSPAGVVPAAAGDKVPQPGSPAGVVPAAAGDKVPQPGSPAGVVPAAAGDKVPQPGSAAGVVPAAAGDKAPQPGSPAGVVPAAAGDKVPQPGSPAGVVPAAAGDKVPQPGSPAGVVPAAAGDKVPQPGSPAGVVPAAAGDKVPQPGSPAGVVPAAAGDKVPQPGSPAGVVPAAAGDKAPPPGSAAGVVPAAAGDKVPQPGSAAGVVPAAAGDKAPQPGSPAGVVPAAAGDKVPQPGSPAGVVPAAGDKAPQPGSPAGVVPADAGDKAVPAASASDTKASVNQTALAATPSNTSDEDVCRLLIERQSEHLSPLTTINRRIMVAKPPLTRQQISEVYRKGCGLVPDRAPDGQPTWREGGMIYVPKNGTGEKRFGSVTVYNADFEPYVPYNHSLFFEGRPHPEVADKDKKIILARLAGWDDVNTPRPLRACPELPCLLTTDWKKYYKSASAVTFNGQLLKGRAPKRYHPDQVFIMYFYEPLTNPWPAYKHLKNRNNGWTSTFNWTMSYHITSDILATYGMVRKRPQALASKNYTEIVSLKSKKVAWFVSHCRTEGKRESYVSELKKYIPVDIYGACGPLKCRKEVDTTCFSQVGRDYKFYFAFENSMCEDYTTEKLYRIFKSDAIIVSRGNSFNFRSLPDGTYIDASEFASPRALADRLLYLDTHDDEYKTLLQRKDEFFSSYQDYPHYVGKYRQLWVKYTWEYVPICEVCQRIWNLDKYHKTYPDILGWLNERKCRAPTDL